MDADRTEHCAPRCIDQQELVERFEDSGRPDIAARIRQHTDDQVCPKCLRTGPCPMGLGRNRRLDRL